MKAATSQQPIYALGDSQQELERMARQAEVFAPFARQLFQQAGIGSGMRVLDIGCGAGDVTFLAAKMVGPSGEVVGADTSASAVEWSRNRASSQGLRNVSFVLGDPALMSFHPQFDVVVGRLVLMYYREPANALRSVANHVRPGGIIAFQEFDMTKMRSFPPIPAFEIAADTMKHALIASGAEVNIGMELISIFLDAGLAEPSLRMDTVIGGASQFPYDIIAATLRSLLPTIHQLNLLSPTDVETNAFEQRMRGEALLCRGIAMSPGLIGAWSHKPA
jgi:SAM-dependent methyltransferase